MQKTILKILTDKKARRTSVIKKSLDKNFTAGAPWITKQLLFLLDEK